MTTPATVPANDGKTRRDLARAMPRDVPRGPWYRIENIGSRARNRAKQPHPGPCVMCQGPIKRNTFSYYQLEQRDDTWSEAVMHYMCARALQYYLGETRLHLHNEPKEPDDRP